MALDTNCNRLNIITWIGSCVLESKKKKDGRKKEKNYRERKKIGRFSRERERDERK